MKKKYSACLYFKLLKSYPNNTNTTTKKQKNKKTKNKTKEEEAENSY